MCLATPEQRTHPGVPKVDNLCKFDFQEHLLEVFKEERKPKFDFIKEQSEVNEKLPIHSRIFCAGTPVLPFEESDRFYPNDVVHAVLILRCYVQHDIEEIVHKLTDEEMKKRLNEFYQTENFLDVHAWYLRWATYYVCNWIDITKQLEDPEGMVMERLRGQTSLLITGYNGIFFKPAFKTFIENKMLVDIVDNREEVRQKREELRKKWGLKKPDE